MIKDDKGYIEKSRGFRNRKKRRREDTPETPEKPKMNPYKREHLNLLVEDEHDGFDDDYPMELSTWYDADYEFPEDGKIDADSLHSQSEWAITE